MIHSTLAPSAHLAQRRIGMSWPLIAALGAFGFGLANGSVLLGDSDVQWHIVTGRWIIAHAAVPHADILSHTMPGAPWVPHEWLAEIAMAAAFDLLGWPGVVMLASAAIAAALGLLTRAMLAVLEPLHALAAVTLAWAMLMPTWLARPHALALPVLVLWTILLTRARARDETPPWLATLLMLAWANLHGSFFMGLGLGGLLAAEAVLAARDWPGRRRSAAHWGAFLAVATLATLATPHGLSGWLMPLQLLGQHASLALVVEWRAPDFQQSHPLEIWLLALIFLAFARGLRLPLSRLLMLLLFVHLALKHQRHGALLGVVGPLLIAPALAPQLRSAVAGGAARLDKLVANLAMPASRAGVALAAMLAIAMAMIALRAPLQPPARVMPEAAVQAALRHGVPGPVLNDYDFGGYLALAGIPVFIDGRVDMYGDAFVTRAVAALHGGGDLPALLERYRIGWTLLAPASPAVAQLDRLQGWRRFHADAAAVVHVRDPAQAREFTAH